MEGASAANGMPPTCTEKFIILAKGTSTSAGPGSNMVFRPPNPIKVDISHLIGGTVEQIKLMLVDQHGKQISSLLGEKFSCVLVIDSE